MKSTIFGLLLSGLSIMAIAQTQSPSANDGSQLPSGRAGEFICPPESVSSQVNSIHDNAFYCQVGYAYYSATDDYTSTGPFSGLRIWGGDYYGCPMAATESFTVTIYNGNPSSGGTIVYTNTINGTTTNIGVTSFSGTPLYQIDLDLGTTVNQLNGWIAISRNGASCSTGFAWAAYGSGNSMSFGGAWENTNSNLMFCLFGPTVPVSNWAIALGIGLILAFAVIRFRRIL